MSALFYVRVVLALASSHLMQHAKNYRLPRYRPLSSIESPTDANQRLHRINRSQGDEVVAIQLRRCPCFSNAQCRRHALQMRCQPDQPRGFCIDR